MIEKAVHPPIRVFVKLSNEKEISMTQNTKHENASGATTHSKRKKLGHWIRITVSVLSGGFVFPHAFTEDDEDTTKHYSDKGTKIKTG